MSLRFHAVEELTANHQVDVESTNKIIRYFRQQCIYIKSCQGIFKR